MTLLAYCLIESVFQAKIEGAEPELADNESANKSEHKKADTASQHASEPQKQDSSAGAPQEDSASARQTKVDDKENKAQMSSKQRQLAGAWGQYCRTVDRQYSSTFQGVEKEVSAIGRSLQTNHNAAHEVCCFRHLARHLYRHT